MNSILVKCATICSILILTPAVALPAAAAEPVKPLDLIPEQAAAALVMTNVEQLKPRADLLFKELGAHGFTASQLLQIAGSILGPGRMIDDTKPLVAIAFDRRLMTEEERKEDNWRHPLAAGVAVTDLAQTAQHLKTTVEELRSGKVLERPGHLDFEHRYYQLDGDYLWIVSHRNLLEPLLARRSVRRWVPESRRAAIESNDLIVSFFADAENFQRKTLVDQFDKWVEQHPEADEEEREALKKLFWFFRAVKYIVFSGSIDRGVTLDIDICFNPAVRRKLGQIIAGMNPRGTSSSLTGLPDGNLLFAHSASSNGRATLPAMSILTREMHKSWWPVWREFEQEQLVNQTQFAELFGLFQHVWNQLDSYRFGIYGTKGPAKHGMISFVAVLETDDAAAFVEEMRELSGLLNGSRSALRGQAESSGPSDEFIRTQIKKLGADNFRDRHSAWAKLLIIGEPALPFVEHAAESPDPHIARKAKDLVTRLRNEIGRKRNKALKPSSLSKAEPQFLFRRDFKQIDSKATHAIELKLEPSSQFVPHLKTLFGPNWNRINLVPVGKQVLVTIGSEPTLTAKALTAMLKGQSPLNGTAGNTVFHSKLLPRKQIELHVSGSRITKLTTTTPEPDIDPNREDAAPQLTSLSLTLQPEALTLQWRVPLAEMREFSEWFR